MGFYDAFLKFERNLTGFFGVKIGGFLDETMYLRWLISKLQKPAR